MFSVVTTYLNGKRDQAPTSKQERRDPFEWLFNNPPGLLPYNKFIGTQETMNVEIKLNPESFCCLVSHCRSTEGEHALARCMIVVKIKYYYKYFFNNSFACLPPYKWLLTLSSLKKLSLLSLLLILEKKKLPANLNPFSWAVIYNFQSIFWYTRGKDWKCQKKVYRVVS